VELYFHSPNTPLWRGVQLKHRDNFTFNKGNTYGKRKTAGKGTTNKNSLFQETQKERENSTEQERREIRKKL
jgi:hypothetical protein